MHIITHLSTLDGYSIYFDYSKGCSQVKHFVSKLYLQHPFDHKQAYSGHLLRLVYSNKFDKSGQLTNRILDYSALSDSVLGDDPLLSLSSYCPNSNFMLVDEYVNKHFILQYVKSHEYSKNYLFKDIIQRRDESHLSLTLTEQHTPVCEHKSNNAVCMFYNDTNNPNIIIKCMDEECGKFVQTFFRYDDNQHRCQIITTGDNSSEKQSSSNTQSSSASNTNSSPNSKSNIQTDKDKDMIQDILFKLNKVSLDKFGLELQVVLSLDNNYFVVSVKSPQHAPSQESRELTGQQKKIFFRKTPNGRIETIDQPKELQKALSKIQREFNSEEITQYNVQFNQFDNSIHYHYHAAPAKSVKDEIIYDDAFKDIQFKSEKHMQFFINIFNNEFQFITKLYNLDSPNEFLYVYDDKDNGQVMFFDNFSEETQSETNGGFWNMQGGFQIAKQKIRDYVVDFFNNVIQQLDPKDVKKKVIQYRLNSIRNDIYNNNRFDQYLMETYINRKIKFNNNPHLLHFQNGTFDLDQRKFIKTTPNMYNTFQIDYDYDDSVAYNEIYQQLQQIMELDQFDWFLKQLSNCLNPKKVTKEKQIVLLIGFGDNGKSMIYNLMTKTLDTKAYSYNGRSVMIQAPNTSASNATPDSAGLLNKRFCYIAELDKKLPFNQQLIKILTGGEEIQARDLFKSLFTFKPSAGIFISSNICPYIDVGDSGFINRFKVIDLRYQFVDNPSNQFQKLIDRNLSDNIDYNVLWKQGFMNLLIDFYYRPRFVLPQSIQASINTRINLQQNPLHLWAKDHIQYSKDDHISCEEIRDAYIRDTDNKIGKITFNKQLNDYINQHPQDFPDVVFKRIEYKTNNDDKINKIQSFKNCKFVP